MFPDIRESMTRKVTANLYMTLDGRGEFTDYPGSDYQTDEPEAFAEMWSKKYGTVDTVVFGRRAFEDHLNYHSERARKPTDPKFLFDYSRWLDRAQKVVLSHHLTKTEWQNSRIMNMELKEVISQLKSEPGKDIIIDGGPSLVQDCIQGGLADDYRVFL